MLHTLSVELLVDVRADRVLNRATSFIASLLRPASVGDQ